MLACVTVAPVPAEDGPEVFDWANLRRRWPAVLPRTRSYGELTREAARRDSDRTLAPRVALVLAIEACKGHR